MRKINLLFIFTFICYSTFSQTADDVGKIALSVVMSTNTDSIDYKEFEKLKSKIQQMTAANGISGNGYYSNFVIYPKFEIFEEETIDAGLTPKTYVKGELSLYVSQASNNLIFNTVSLNIMGIGEKKDKAILNAISRIDTRDDKLAPFFKESKSKIISYYESNCELIASKAKSLVKKQQYQEAIGLLMSVPEEVQNCYQKIQDETVNAYLAYQNNICDATMLQAKSEIAKKAYTKALNTLTNVDSESKCFTNAEVLISEIDKEISRIEQRDYDDKQQAIKQRIAERNEIRNNKKEIELSRIEAIKQIAAAYFRAESNKPQNSQNVYFIR
ncbi:SPFH domain-containing protein [Winogradskyella helgolandensis]|uniref:hypothetical protein n=1 Tax=Winogradskyella helgolandensis TaxID=2697010 RepID=UPI0015C8DA66|nr:hypothetical protein [Winogradskyella helgolandensis]